MNNAAKMAISRQAETAPVEIHMAPANDFTCPISPLKLAYLNFGLFQTLYKMDTSRERICSALALSAREFDYMCKLGGLQQAT